MAPLRRCPAHTHTHRSRSSRQPQPQVPAGMARSRPALLQTRPSSRSGTGWLAGPAAPPRTARDPAAAGEGRQQGFGSLVQTLSTAALAGKTATVWVSFHPCPSKKTTKPGCRITRECCFVISSRLLLQAEPAKLAAATGLSHIVAWQQLSRSSRVSGQQAGKHMAGQPGAAAEQASHASGMHAHREGRGAQLDLVWTCSCFPSCHPYLPSK